jgi:hypothetical protein
VPWNLALAALSGVWLMFSPAIFALGGTAANNHYLAGALAVTFIVIAWGEIARTARWLGVVLGIWFAISTWLIGDVTAAACWNDLLAGVAMALLSIRKGNVNERFGTFDRWIF